MTRKYTIVHRHRIIFTRDWRCYVNTLPLLIYNPVTIRFLATSSNSVFLRTRLSNMASPSPKKSKSPKIPKTPSKRETASQLTSPRSSPSRNLSDVAKRSRECCANWHENVHKWSKLNELGTSVANKLVNLQLQKE